MSSVLFPVFVIFRCPFGDFVRSAKGEVTFRTFDIRSDTTTSGSYEIDDCGILHFYNEDDVLWSSIAASQWLEVMVLPDA